MTTGNTRNEIQYADPIPDSSSSSASKTASPTSTPSAASATVSSAPSDTPTKGPNTAGIAAGVVVGVVVLAAIIGGVFFYLRRQKRQAVEEEYRRQAAVSSFVSGGKLHTSNSSMTDSRLDPEFMARRQSNGSIADNEDYSRRILKVGHSAYSITSSTNIARLRTHKHLDDGHHDRPTTHATLPLAFDEIPNLPYPPRLIPLLLCYVLRTARTPMPDESKNCIHLRTQPALRARFLPAAYTRLLTLEGRGPL